MTSDRPLRAAARLLSVAAALLTTVCVSACGSSAQYLDTVNVERAVAKSILKERDLYATVACPSQVPQKAGHVFTCTARLDVGTYPVTAREIDGSGRVRFQDERPLVVLNVATVQQAIETSVFSREAAALQGRLSSRGATASRTRLQVYGSDRRGGAPLSVRGERGRRFGSCALPRTVPLSTPSARVAVEAAVCCPGGIAHTTAGTCWVMQWMLPPPSRISRASTPMTRARGSTRAAPRRPPRRVRGPAAGTTTRVVAR